MCYPHIFVGGSCDITIKLLRNVDYVQWVEHVYYNVDNRVSANPFLKFHLLNIGFKKRALTQGSYCVSQQINESLLSIEELSDRLENNDDSIARKIIGFAGNLPNTDPYWKARKVELNALNFFLLKEFQLLPTYFDTSSCAEHHWKPLHQLLIKYHCTTKKLNEQDVTETFNNDPRF